MSHPVVLIGLAAVLVGAAITGCAPDSGSTAPSAPATPAAPSISSAPAPNAPTMPPPSTRAERVAAEVVGMTETDAQARAEQAGLTTRVVQRDGEQFPVTMDYSPQRLNLVIESGTVTAATVG